MTDRRYAITEHDRYVAVSLAPAALIDKDLAMEILTSEIELSQDEDKALAWVG